MSKTTTVTLSNSFHGTETRVRVPQTVASHAQALGCDVWTYVCHLADNGDGAMRRRVRRVRRALCGCTGCACGVVR